MKDKLLNELHKGDLIIDLDNVYYFGYGDFRGIGIATGATRGGKIKYMTPDPNYFEDENDDDMRISDWSLISVTASRGNLIKSNIEQIREYVQRLIVTDRIENEDRERDVGFERDLQLEDENANKFIEELIRLVG